jgi:hypothetical protein
MAKELLELLEPDRQMAIRAALKAVVEQLGDAYASQRTAEKILSFIESTTE